MSPLIVDRIHLDCKPEPFGYNDGMRGVAVLLAGLAALSVAGASLATSTPRPILAQAIGGPTQAGQDAASGATARLSSSRAGARPVSLTLMFETVFVCGQPRSVLVTLPKGVAMPSRFAPGSVLVNGHVAANVSTAGRAVTVSAASGGKMTCHSLRLGTELLVFTAKAQLANPGAPGRYTIGIKHGTTVASASVTITS